MHRHWQRSTKTLIDTEMKQGLMSSKIMTNFRHNYMYNNKLYIIVKMVTLTHILVLQNNLPLQSTFSVTQTMLERTVNNDSHVPHDIPNYQFLCILHPSQVQRQPHLQHILGENGESIGAEVIYVQTLNQYHMAPIQVIGHFIV